MITARDSLSFLIDRRWTSFFTASWSRLSFSNLAAFKFSMQTFSGVIPLWGVVARVPSQHWGWYIYKILYWPGQSPNHSKLPYPSAAFRKRRHNGWRRTCRTWSLGLKPEIMKNEERATKGTVKFSQKTSSSGAGWLGSCSGASFPGPWDSSMKSSTPQFGPPEEYCYN